MSNIHESHNIFHRGEFIDGACSQCLLCVCHNSALLEEACAPILHHDGIPTKDVKPHPPKTRRVPLTLNFDWSRVVGYADVDMVTGEMTAHISSVTETGAELVKLMGRDMVRAMSLTFELDGRLMREEEMKAIVNKFKREPGRNWMTDPTLPGPEWNPKPMKDPHES